MSHKRNDKEKARLRILGEFIRQKRIDKGYSQEKLAGIVGFSRSYYTEIETGERNIAFLNFLRLVETLNIDTEELLQEIKNNTESMDNDDNLQW